MNPDVFYSIQEFTKVRTHCLFCNFPLTAELSNFSGYSFKKIPRLNAALVDGYFGFRLERCTMLDSVETDGYLSAESGKIEFSGYKYLSTPFDNDPHVEIDAFIDLSPYISLNCNNPFCKMSYYAASNILNIDRVKNIVRPVMFNWEAFNYKKFWVQNDWIHMKTLIYSTSHQEAPPIKYPLIDFRDFEKEKLFTRIKTLVTFS